MPPSDHATIPTSVGLQKLYKPALISVMLQVRAPFSRNVELVCARLDEEV
jgi:hypothetical protein